jgi:hypothetical protein
MEALADHPIVEAKQNCIETGVIPADLAYPGAMQGPRENDQDQTLLVP